MLDSGSVCFALLSCGAYGAVDRIKAYTGVEKHELILFIAYVASLHDIGKCHPAFQAKDPATRERLEAAGLLSGITQGDIDHVRHEAESAVILKRLLTHRLASKKSIRQIAAITACHHQGREEVFTNIPDPVNRAFYEAAQAELEALCFRQFPFREAPNLPDCGHTDAVCTLICGLVILSDWLASGFMTEPNDAETDKDAYAALSRSRAEALINELGFADTGTLAPTDRYDALFPFIHTPRPMQVQAARLAKERPSLLLIEAPTGEGKTEASIIAASQMGEGTRGLYYALPTAATSNAMYTRLQAVSESKVRLLHSAAWLTDAVAERTDAVMDAPERRDWFTPLKRGLLAANAVGTVDQAMLAALHVNYGVLRLLGLSGKVLVIDEIHAYDSYMSKIIDRLLSWCAALQVPVVLLSATLPCSRRNSLLAAYTGKDPNLQSRTYPLITSVKDGVVTETDGGEVSFRRELYLERQTCLEDAEATAQLAVRKVQNGGCCCVIVNTVAAAQQTYTAIKLAAGAELWLGVLHARLPAGVRLQREKLCDSLFGKRGARPKRAILVSTQIVEQSCDYSFDFMISQIAPIDLLLQRAGRLQRHAGIGLCGLVPPVLTILVPKGKDFGASSAVYYAYLLEKTQAYLLQNDRIDIPNGVRAAIEYVYDGEPLDAELKNWYERSFNMELQAATAEAVMLRSPQSDTFGLYARLGRSNNADDMDALNAVTRLGEPSVQVLLLDENCLPTAAQMQSLSLDAVKELLRQGVTLRRSQFPNIGSSGYLSPMEGGGKLSHCWIVPMRNNVYQGKNAYATLVYTLSDELGLVIERRKN